jgi:hypothetical protein
MSESADSRAGADSLAPTPVERDLDEVLLDVPARPRSLRLLRLAAADAAAGLDLDVDSVEAARIAVDELAAILLTSGVWTRLQVRLRTQDGVLRVHGTVTGLVGEEVEVHVDGVVDELLAVCVESFELLPGPAFRFSIAPKVPVRSSE